MPRSIAPSLRAASVVFVAAVAGAGASRAAHADAPADPREASYYWDGGALPLFWGALGAATALELWASPRATPLLFNADEGGERAAAWEVPGWTLEVGAVAAGLTIALAGDDSRWDHVKGLAESVVTAKLLTVTLKNTFGRRRPDSTAEDLDPDARRSFPSGHATNAFAIGTYSALYLREHVFDRARGRGSLVTPGEALTYVGIAAGATALSLERMYHNRHHAIDVLVGGAVGTATATAVFLYQEHRFHRRGRERDAPALMLHVAGDAPVLQIGGVF